MTKPTKEPMTQWQKFALLIFAIGALIAIVVVYMAIKGDLARML